MFIKETSEFKTKNNFFRGTLKSIGVIILLLTYAGIFYSQTKIQRPTSDFAIMDFVPIDIAMDIAWIKAKEIAGDKISMGEVIYASNGFGKISSYMFVFKVGEYSFPTDEEILATIRKGIAYEKNISENRIPEELKTAIDPNEIMSKLKQMAVPIYRSDGTLTGLYRKIEREELSKLARKMKYGIDEYITIYVSSSYSNFPIPHYKKSLPPFYYGYEMAINEAYKIFGSNYFILSKYYFIGHRGEFFEFTTMKSKILINAFSNKIVIEKEKVLTPKIASRISSNRKQIIDNAIKEEWTRLIKKARKKVHWN